MNNARIAGRKSYMVAVALPIATRSLDQAREILRGVAQAQTELNQQQGTQRIPLKVLIARDDNDRVMAERVALALVQRPDVLGVIGHFSSDTTEAAGQIYQQHHLVMISATSTAVKISALGDFIFRTVPTDHSAAQVLACYIKTSLKASKAAIYHAADSVYSQSLRQEFRAVLADRAIGGQVVQVVQEFDLAASSQFNALTTLETANQQQAKVLAMFPDTKTRPQTLEVIQETRQDFKLIGGDSMYDNDILQDGQQYAEGMVVAVPWVFRAEDAFARRAAQLWQGSVNWRTVTAYDAIQAMAAGLKRHPTRSGIQQTLSAPGFVASGATDTIQFSRSAIAFRKCSWRSYNVSPIRSLAIVLYPFCPHPFANSKNNPSKILVFGARAPKPLAIY
ncbi:MAG: ABC transporter substrate-binding protein [Leptolyngbyaceae cyanobacterium CRU_2_3]|nr:ABC transporter substrate-binding protein [Leptolyngbyaceae cyanobacterium CRU_2_3]